MTDPVTPSSDNKVVAAVKDYIADVKAHPGRHAFSALTGALIMRAVDTRVIRANLGDNVANQVNSKLFLGNLPLING